MRLLTSEAAAKDPATNPASQNARMEALVIGVLAQAATRPSLNGTHAEIRSSCAYGVGDGTHCGKMYA